jgi:ribose transport system permease protein
MTQASETSASGSPVPPQTSSVGTGQSSPPRRRAVVLVRRYWPAFVLLVVVVIVVSVAVPDFFTRQNLLLVGEQSAVTGVTAVGMTFVVITAGIDLSVGATLGLVSVVTALMLQHHHHAPTPLIFVAGLLIGVGAGLLNAIGVAWMRMQPFVLTLATSAILGGLALNLSGGTQLQLPLISGGILGFLGNGDIVGVPAALVVFLVCALVGGFVLRFTPYGRYTYAVGDSMEAARLSGIPVRRILLGAYAIAGLCAALAGILATARVNVGDPNAGSLTTLNAIAAVVIGGTSLFGGSGGMTGSVFGAILLSALADALNVKGVSAFDQEIWQGVVIIIAILWTTARSQGAKKLQSLRLRMGGPNPARKGNTANERA